MDFDPIAERPAPTAGLLRILFVDDEARILRALKALFRDVEVYSTADPREAPELARKHDIDVVVCDQRMPEVLGVEVLREIRLTQPRAMRILLTGYSDLKSVVGSVNEGEVFRFVNKPWVNADLRALVFEAGRIARDAPVVTADLQISESDKALVRSEVGILVIEEDSEVQQRLREILQPYYQVRFANTAERALQILEQNETGVVISETETTHGDLTALLKALKQFHPHIATVVITERANAQTIIDLINEGQVYRMLLKPVRMGSCRLSVDSALGRYWQLKSNPQAARRFMVARVADDAPTSPLRRLPANLIQRLRSLPARFLGARRF
jgi:DNA-binding NtrC family response regulator